MLEAFSAAWQFRRPATGKEIDRYAGIFEKALERGEPYEQAVKFALKGVLISPSFLFLIETPPEKKGVYQLDHYEIASHLSYFLWASTPDAELLRLAAQGKLHDDAVLREQVGRLMRDPRSPRPCRRLRRAMAWHPRFGRHDPARRQDLSRVH